METTAIKIRHSLRLGNEKAYWNHQLQKFADQFDPEKVLEVQYGKQDIRGTESITLIDHRHCVPKQLHFPNKWALLYYVQGYNEAYNKESCYNTFARFI